MLIKWSASTIFRLHIGSRVGARRNKWFQLVVMCREWDDRRVEKSPSFSYDRRLQSAEEWISPRVCLMNKSFSLQTDNLIICECDASPVSQSSSIRHLLSTFRFKAGAVSTGDWLWFQLKPLIRPPRHIHFENIIVLARIFVARLMTKQSRIAITFEQFACYFKHSTVAQTPALWSKARAVITAKSSIALSPL